ncbi:hypothetical protein HYY75_06040 [bacterium]|nr:hypothetical protein [bacterium]
MSRELKCPQCGEIISANHRICRNCGTRKVNSGAFDDEQKAKDLPIPPDAKSKPIPLNSEPSKGEVYQEPILPPPNLNSVFYLRKPVVPEKKPGWSISDVFVWGIVLFFIGGVVLYCSIPNFCYKKREQPREKACYAYLRVILGAIEMYNMDNSLMKTSLVDSDTQTGLLLQGNYLKRPIPRIEKGCAFSSTGDLTTSGYISCSVHGPVHGP